MRYDLQIRRAGDVVWNSSTAEGDHGGSYALEVIFRVLHTSFGVPDALIRRAAADLGLANLEPGDTLSGTVTDEFELESTVHAR